MSANLRKKIKLSKVREIIVTRLRDDLRQPTLLKSAIEQGRKERDSALPIFTKTINPFPQQRFDLDAEDTREIKLRAETNLKAETNFRAETNLKQAREPESRTKANKSNLGNLFKPVALSKMIG